MAGRHGQLKIPLCVCERERESVRLNVILESGLLSLRTTFLMHDIASQSSDSSY